VLQGWVWCAKTKKGRYYWQLPAVTFVLHYLPQLTEFTEQMQIELCMQLMVDST
jgi:hypothetical protein